MLLKNKFLKVVSYKKKYATLRCFDVFITGSAGKCASRKSQGSLCNSGSPSPKKRRLATHGYEGNSSKGSVLDLAELLHTEGVKSHCYT